MICYQVIVKEIEDKYGLKLVALKNYFQIYVIKLNM